MGSGAGAVGRYELLDRIAAGGMGEILHARAHGEDGFVKDIVIKRIRPDRLEDPDFHRMFLEEARTAVQLSHGNIVQVYDFGRIDGAYFLAMERVDGADLRQLLHAGGALPVPVALSIAAGILQGLDHAHRKLGRDGAPLALVHRDLKPPNVLVSYEGEVKVTDFGISRAAGSVRTTEDGTGAAAMIVAVAALWGIHRSVPAFDDYATRSGWAPIHQAAHAASLGNFNYLQQLLDAGVSVDLQSAKGITPLGIAAYDGSVPAIRFLLARGASIDLADDDSDAPLFVAIGANRVDAAVALLDAGADANRPGIRNHAPLDWAATRHEPEVVRALLRHGATLVTPESTGSEHITPLHSAAWAADGETVRLLLDAGADPRALTGPTAWIGPPILQIPNMTPAQVARTVGAEPVARILDEAAGRFDPAAPIR